MTYGNADLFDRFKHSGWSDATNSPMRSEVGIVYREVHSSVSDNPATNSAGEYTEMAAVLK